MPQPKLFYPAKRKKAPHLPEADTTLCQVSDQLLSPREQGLLENVQRAAGLGRPAASRRSVLAGLPIFGFQQNRHLTQNSVRFFFFYVNMTKRRLEHLTKTKKKLCGKRIKMRGLPRQDAMTNRPCAVVIPYKGEQSVTCSARFPAFSSWRCRLPSWVRPSRPDWSGAPGRCPAPARARLW